MFMACTETRHNTIGAYVHAQITPFHIAGSRSCLIWSDDQGDVKGDVNRRVRCQRISLNFFTDSSNRSPTTLVSIPPPCLHPPPCPLRLHAAVRAKLVRRSSVIPRYSVELVALCGHKFRDSMCLHFYLLRSSRTSYSKPRSPVVKARGLVRQSVQSFLEFQSLTSP